MNHLLSHCPRSGIFRTRRSIQNLTFGHVNDDELVNLLRNAAKLLAAFLHHSTGVGAAGVQLRPRSPAASSDDEGGVRPIALLHLPPAEEQLPRSRG